jgi:hypothetical protein
LFKKSNFICGKGRVVFWKGFDVNVSINSLLTQSKKRGKVSNILLHHKTNSEVISFIEFEEKESATSFVSGNPYKYSMPKSYVKIVTRNQSTLVCLFMFYFINYTFSLIVLKIICLKDEISTFYQTWGKLNICKTDGNTCCV